MAFTMDDLNQLETKITGPGGVLEKIGELAEAGEEGKSAKIIGLIGSIIGLIITAIKAAID